MARPRTAADAARAASGGLSFSDVPPHLRPSAWKRWLDAVSEVDPRARDYDDDPRWRHMLADVDHQTAYAEWCRGHHLLVPGAETKRDLSLGDIVRGWWWSDLQKWELEQRDTPAGAR